MRTPIWLAAAAGLIVGGALHAQNPPPAEASARLSGTWTLNRELSPGFRAPGARPGGPGRGGGAMANRFNVAPAAPVAALQRRGGSGGDSPTGQSEMTPADLAAMAAIRQLSQLSEEVTITATADKVTFVDGRGERSYVTDGKNAKIMVGDAEVTTKTKWDKAALKQEFSTSSVDPMASAKLTQTWEINADGRLVLTAKIESRRLRTPDQKAVFDKKPAS
jgi:hypothetical protein